MVKEQEPKDIPSRIRGHREKAYMRLLDAGTIVTHQEFQALHEGVDPIKANVLVRQEISFLRKKYGRFLEIYTVVGQGYVRREKGEGYITLPDGKKIMVKNPAQAMTLASIIAAGEQGVSTEILAQPHIEAGKPLQSAINRVRWDIKSIRTTLGADYDIVNLTQRGARHFGIKAVYAFKILGSPVNSF